MKLLTKQDILTIAGAQQAFYLSHEIELPNVPDACIQALVGDNATKLTMPQNESVFELIKEKCLTRLYEPHELNEKLVTITLA